MRAIGRKRQPVPIDENEYTGCSIVGFSKGKSCYYPITKGRILTVFFTPFLLKRKDKRYTYGIFYYGDYNFKNAGLRNRGRPCGMGRH